MENYKTHLESVGKTTTVAAKAMSGLKKAGSIALNIGAGLAAGFAIDGLLKLFDYAIHYEENIVKKADEAKSSISESFSEFSNGQKVVKDLGSSFASSGKEINSTKDAISSIADKYTELSIGVDKLSNANKSLSTSEYDDYLNICNQLADQFPSLVSGYDEQGNAILNLGGNAESATSSLTKLYEAQMLSANVEIGNNLNTQFRGYQKTFNDYEKENKRLNKEITKTEEAILNIKEMKSGVAFEKGEIVFDSNAFGTDKKYREFRKELDKALTEAKISYTDAGTDEDGLTHFSIGDVTEKDLEKVKKAVDKYAPQELLDNLSVDKNELMRKQDANELMLKESWDSMASSIGSYLQTSKSFTDLDNNLQSAFIGNVDKLNPEVISEEYDGDVQRFLYGEVIKPLSDLKPEAQNKLSDLLTLDSSNMNLEDYQNKVNKTFRELFPKDGKLQKQMKRTFGFEDVANEAKNQLDVLTDKFGDAAKSLTIDELQKGYDLILNDKTDYTFDQFKSKIEKAKQLAATSINLKANTKFDAITVADETANAGDDYVKAQTYLKEAKEMLDKGLVGTDDFKTRAAYFSHTGADDPVNFAENYATAARYLTEDSSGVVNFLNDLSTKTNDAGQALASFDESTGKWTYNINDLQQASKDMGIGFEFMMDMFGRLEDYGFSNNFVGSVEDGTARIAEKTKELAEAEAELARLQSEGADTTAITQQQEKVNALKNDINETRDAMGQLVARSGAEYAEQVSNAKEAIGTLNAERQKILKENTYGEDTQAVADAMEEQIRQWASENHLELDANLNVVNKEQVQDEINTSPIEVKIEAKAEDASSIIGGLGHGQSVSIPVEIDGESSEIEAFKNFDGTITYTADIDGVETELEPVKEADGTITYTVKSDYNEDGFRKDVEVAVDYIIGSQEEPETKEALLDYIKAYQEDPEFRQALMNYIMFGQQDPAAKQALLDYIKASQEVPIDENSYVNYLKGSQENPESPQSGIVDWGLGSVSLPNLSLTGIINWISGGDGQLAGTAHKDGTVGGLSPIPKLSGRALAMGTLQDTSWLKPSWMTKQNQVALTGEEDQELVVKNCHLIW